MSIQIARGASGDMSPVAPFSSAFGAGDCYCNDGQTLCPWYIESPSAQFSVGGDIKSCQDPDASRGFGVSGTTVSVPADAVLGLYHAYLQFEQDRTMEYYEFEVVCMTIEISTTETHRDEATYKLSCTAMPQGGTVPYTYNWSGNVIGSTALGELDESTLEIEIPINSAGSIAVSVSDSGTPPCIASASFSVCGHMTCEFTVALISTPPAGATGPYVYECDSSSQSAFGPVEHEWSPTPIWVSEDGTVAQFSFSDDDEHSIDLTVTDTEDCSAFKTHKVGGYEFVVSTDPSGEDTGTVLGTRDTMEFTVAVKAQVTGNFIGPHPAQLTFEFSRPATNSVGTVVGALVAGSSPPRYEFGWNVTQAKGRFQIKVSGYKSNTANFKIKKREQIVEVAQSWVGALQGSTGGAYCDDFVGSVYGQVGLSVTGGGNAVDDLYNSTDTIVQDSQQGSIAFYHFPSDNNATWRHAAVNVGGQIVDQNCGLPHSVYPTYIDPLGYPQTDNDHPPTIGQHSATDVTLVNPTKYAEPSYHSTSELQQLDNE